MATLWLTVYEFHDGPGYGFPYELWSREITLEHSLRAGDNVFFLASEDEPDGSVMTNVKHTYCDIFGKLNVELRPIVHLPNERKEEEFNSRPLNIYNDEAYLSWPMPWREKDDAYGLLSDRLSACGWLRWSDRKTNR